MRVHPVFVFALAFGVQALVGVLARGSRWRRIGGAVVAFLALPLPLLMPDVAPFLRFVLGLGLGMACLRTLDLVRERGERSVAFRIGHVVMPLDTRRFQSAPATFERRHAVVAVAFGLLALASFGAIHELAPTSAGPGSLVLRWGAGLVFAYAITDVVYALSTVGFHAVGVQVYELHRAPALARSVQEFWGERWNRTVSAWLGEHFLRPFARRRWARLGVLAAFGASGLLHAYLVLISIGGPMTLLVLGYFLVQGALVLVELRLRVAKWQPLAGRAWTAGVMVATSPMFIEPMLRVLRW